MTDIQLLRKLQNRDPKALEQAIDRFGGYVAAIVRNRGSGQLSPEDTEELVSDVFLRLWQHSPRIQADRLKAWLGSVARNLVTDALRRVRPVLPLEEQALWIEDSLWQRLAEEERAALLRDALAQLEPRDREIFHRAYGLCQSSAQIAEAMGMPASTVRTRLSRGRQAIRKTLEQGGIKNVSEL